MIYQIDHDSNLYNWYFDYFLAQNDGNYDKAIEQIKATVPSMTVNGFIDGSDTITYLATGIEQESSSLFGSYDGYIKFMQWLNPNVDNIEYKVQPPT